MLHTLIETLLIVVVVIFLFLGSFRSVLIPVVAIPISLIGAVFLMLVAGFTINLLTLLAIVLSVGLVVDDAIVMVENVERHLHMGKPPFQAAMDAARELVGPIIAMTITLAAVYAPIGIQGGLTGALFREFAFTLAGAVVVSGVVALTLSPMMAFEAAARGRYGARLCRHRQPALRARPQVYTRVAGRNAAISACRAHTLGDRRSADGSVLHVLPAGTGALGGSGSRVRRHSGFRRTRPSTRPTCSPSRSTTSTIRSPRARASFRSRIPTGGFGGMVTKPWSQRKKTAQQLLLESSGPLSKIAGIRVIPLTPPPLPGGGNFPVDFVIASAAEPQQVSRLRRSSSCRKPWPAACSSSPTPIVKFDQPQTEVVFDRDKLRSQGVDLSQAGADLSTMLGGNYVNRFSIQGRSYKVIPQVKRVDRLTPDQLSQIYVKGSADKLVPLSTFATLKTTTEPRSLNKFQQLNAVRIQGVIPPNVPLDKALTFLEDQAKQILPQGFTVDYAGESRQLRVEGSKFLGTFLLSAILIYLVLAAQFESFRDPFIILAGSVPLAISGALMFSFL